MRSSVIVRLGTLSVAVVGALAAASPHFVSGQEVALAARHPRFLYAPSKGATPVEIDASKSVVLQRVVSLEIEQPTVGRLLAEIERQTGVRFIYDGGFRTGRPLTFRAESLTVASALAAILHDAGVDVVLSRGRYVGLVEAKRGIVAGQTGTVTGQVTDGKTGSGLTGVDVSLEGKRWRAATDADGRYRLADVAPGSYTVVARRIGYGPERRPVTVTAGQETPVDVALHPAAARLDEVVVTAQKREERLQDVPLSIAVVSAEQIDERGLFGAADYLRGVPGVNQSEGGQYAQSIVIRGIETSPRAQNFSSGATVATYFGETPTINSAGLAGGSNVDLKLVDIERVEVLRGPQGTAFGSSSMGGAVRTIPVAPRLDRVEGKLAASYSATSKFGGDNHNFQAVGNLPLLKDKLALRAVGYRYEESGFYRNRAASDAAFQAAVVARYGAPAFTAIDEENVGDYYVLGGRLSALWQASDDLRFTLSYLSQKTEADGIGLATSGTYEQTHLQIGHPGHVLRGRTSPLFDTDIDIVNATTEYSLGWADLLATYSYINSESSGSGLSFGHHLAMSGIGVSDHRAHVGEIRLATKLAGAWNFLAGVYYEDLEDDALFDYRWFGDPATSPFAIAPGGLFSSGNDLRDRTQKAAFGEVSWELLTGVTLTGGVRAYQYDRTFRGYGVNAAGPTAAPNLHTNASGENFRANLSYKPAENALVYGGWSEGFRLGRPQRPFDSPGPCDVNGDGLIDGTNTTTASTGNIYSDDVDSYEIGGKFALLDHRLTIDAAVFRMDWTGMPVRVLAPPVPQGCGFAFQANAGESRSEGVEFQASLRIAEPFRVDFGGSWMNARLTEDVPALNALSGNRLAASPKVNANLGLQYEFKVGRYEPFVRADAIYVGDFYGDILESPALKAGDYVKLDVSTRVVVRHLNIDLFVRNVTNEDAFSLRDLIPAIQREFFGYRLRPRTIGAQFGYSF